MARELSTGVFYLAEVEVDEEVTRGLEREIFIARSVGNKIPAAFLESGSDAARRKVKFSACDVVKARVHRARGSSVPAAIYLGKASVEETQAQIVCGVDSFEFRDFHSVKSPYFLLEFALKTQGLSFIISHKYIIIHFSEKIK